MKAVQLMFITAAISVSLPVAAPQSSTPKVRALYQFGADLFLGGNPAGPPVKGAHGVLYGVTSHGGSGCPNFGCGVVYALNPPGVTSAWTEQVIYNPTVPGPAAAPLVIGAHGELYGAITGVSDGSCPSNACGMVFMLTPPTAAGGAWTETTLHTFAGGSDGSAPTGVVMGPNGVLYGTTTHGGISSQCGSNDNQTGCGTVFMLTPPSASGGEWTETLLHVFQGSPADGQVPVTGLVVGKDGALYGTTLQGGAATGTCLGSSGCGTVYRLTPPNSPGGSWTESIPYSFAGGSDGSRPGLLVSGPGGNLYGLADSGTSPHAQAFELQPSTGAAAWTKTVLHTFRAHEGTNPTGLVAGPRGTLWGTNRNGGRRLHGATYGTIFELVPPKSAGLGWTTNIVYQFRPHDNSGGEPVGLTIAADGVLYGATTLAAFKVTP